MEIATTHGRQILLVRGTRLLDSPDSGYVVVFDDITTMVQAQRDAAWGEVARRLAHEIKNPLTPIQLSAERLEHKLTPKLEGQDITMLKRATATIVSQVTAMKAMVNEFSEYARAPALNLGRVDLNQLIKDVLALYEPVGVEIEVSLKDGLPSISGDITMLRQVLHNLLQNAQDASESQDKPTISICSAVEGDRVKLTVRDNGTGFPMEILSRAFEPYMTTKRHGTGLGLAIVRKIVEEHKGNIRLENSDGSGAIVTVTLPIAADTTKQSNQDGV
jgi:nitrogen fixation/metabolism regulation signal transduction histidine kinase